MKTKLTVAARDDGRDTACVRRDRAGALPPVRQVASTSLLGACGPECIVGTAACEPARRGTVKAVSGRLSEAERERRADLADAARLGGWGTEEN